MITLKVMTLEDSACVFVRLHRIKHVMTNVMTTERR
jgi:hypothetical protein